MSYETIIPEKGIKYTWIEDKRAFKRTIVALRQSIIKKNI